MRKEGKRKALAALVCGSMLTVALVGGTLAYLSDTDSDVNVMTLGNVSIEQIEQERVDTTKLPTDDGNLKGFTQDKPLYPAVFEGASIPWDANSGVNEAWKAVASNENVVDKFVTVENTGDSAAYVRTIVAFEGNEEYGPEGKWIHVVFNGSNVSDEIQSSLVGVANIGGVDYTLYEFVYKKALEPGKTSIPSLKQVYMNKAADNDVVAKYGDTYEILVLSQAVQTNGFSSADEALDAAFGSPEAKNDSGVMNVVAWFSGDEFEIPTAAATAEELTAALENGESVYLTDDIELAENSTITIGSGVSSTMNLNGHTLSAENTRTDTHNFMIDVKGGELSISNGTVSMKHTGTNMGWSGATTVIDVTAGGVLNLEGVTVKNEGGTDMNFGVHLNNWGEVTLNADNCVFDSDYCGVRVFNSGYDMNNVTITDSTLKGKNRAFWVHNYIGDLNSAQHSDEAIKARLNLDIYGNDNTFVLSEEAKSPIRYGFGTTVYLNVNDGSVIE